jgi:hypothetical protein
VRIRLTLDITRTRHRDRDRDRDDPIFEHRDNDTAIEATYGGDVSLHRMGFTPGPDDADPRA